VHLDDLATSIDTLDLTLPVDAITLACHLGIDISMRRHGPLPVLQALYRSDGTFPTHSDRSRASTFMPRTSDQLST
jgi:hypothetical protein